jgi:iron complex outermembrane receptor protein
MRYLRRRRTLKFVLAAECVRAATLFAQEKTSLEPVIVNAGRLEQSRFDAPASVDAVDAEAIGSTGTRVNLSSALFGVPGVVSLPRNNYAQDLQISIRGFGARSAFGLRGIRLIVDDIPATTPDGQGQASSVSLASTDRVEVLRGPLALLYGNASGGVIRTYTREAGSEPQANAEIYGGSQGLFRSDWQASGRYGTFGTVADFSTFYTDGWRANSAALREQFNTVLTFDQSPDTRIRVIANLYNMPFAKDPLGLTAAQLASNPGQAGTNALLNGTRKQVRQDQVGTVLDQKLSSEVQLQARGYVGTRDNLQYQASAIPGSPAATWIGLNRLYDGVGMQLSGRHSLAESIGVQWVAGIDLDRSSEDRQAGPTLNGEQVANSITRKENNTASNRDAFAQANWYFGEHWSAVTGVRFSNVTLSSRDNYLSDGNGSGDVSYHAASPIVGVTWHANDTLNLYANIGDGFETPTLAEVAYTRSGKNIIATFNPGLQAARSYHQEVGIKWRPMPNLMVDAALFRIRTDDEIVASLSSAGKTAYANAASTLRDGAELALRYRPDPHWRFDSALTFIQATYDTPFNSGATPVASGNALPGIPSRQLYTALNWYLDPTPPGPTGWRNGPGGAVEWIARSGIWVDDANSAYAGGTGIVNLRAWGAIKVAGLPLQAFASIDNITDRQYVGSVIVNQAQQQFYEPALRRTWTLGVRIFVPL